MRTFQSAETREAHRAAASRGGQTSAAMKRAARAEGMAAAIEWRESRRCKSCGTLGYYSCAHRPNGAFQ